MERRETARHKKWLKSPETREKVKKGELILLTPEDKERRDEPMRALRQALRGWGKKFRIDQDWAYDEALFTMVTYADRMKRDPDDRWTDDFAPHWGSRHSVWGAPLSSEDIAFGFDLEKGWEPTCERWANFRDRAKEEFDSKLEKYGREVRTKVEAEGYIQAPTVREPLHFIWLAERVVLGKSWAEIGTAHGRSRETIRSAVKAAAILVGISISTQARSLKPESMLEPSPPVV
ncbi:MAG: hypothetical protein H0W86_13510 [Armatimonadetes bacterium]|nr:hypothetical protein [Armatimonadota bacterium]